MSTELIEASHHRHGVSEQNAPIDSFSAGIENRPLLAFLLGLYTVIIGIMALYALTDVLVKGPISRTIIGSFGKIEPAIAITIRHLMLTTFGAALGSVLHSLFGLWVHACVIGNFRATFTGSYLLGPSASGLLGAGTFFVFQGGILALGGGLGNNESLVQTHFFYSAIGILIGLSFDAVLIKIDGVTRQFFGAPEHSFMDGAMKSARQYLSMPQSSASNKNDRTNTGDNPV